MLDCTASEKPDFPPLVVMGNGEFGIDPSSIHKKFARYFVSKCRGMGIDVYLLSEHFTSQTCPRCFHHAESDKVRQKVCTVCEEVYHRDLMAAHNMAIIAIETLFGEGRPKPFQFEPRTD